MPNPLFDIYVWAAGLVAAFWVFVYLVWRKFS